MTGNGRVERLRRWLLALTVVVVAGAVAAPIIGNALLTSKNAETQLVVSCQGVKNQVVILGALRQVFEDQLGVPWLYPIPEVPPECDGS